MNSDRPVHPDTAPSRALIGAGGSIDQLRAAGSYVAPSAYSVLPSLLAPPQTSIWVPVQTPAALVRPEMGAVGNTLHWSFAMALALASWLVTVGVAVGGGTVGCVAGRLV